MEIGLLYVVTLMCFAVFLLCFGFVATRMWSSAYFQSKLEYQNAFFSSLNRPNQEAPSNGTKV